MAQTIIVVSVKDRLSDIYSQPMYFPTEGMAIRSFQDALGDSQNAMSKHPDDYDLYVLGTFDDQLGQFTNERQPRQIAIGKQLKQG